MQSRDVQSTEDGTIKGRVLQVLWLMPLNLALKEREKGEEVQTDRRRQRDLSSGHNTDESICCVPCIFNLLKGTLLRNLGTHANGLSQHREKACLP